MNRETRREQVRQWGNSEFELIMRMSRNTRMTIAAPRHSTCALEGGERFSLLGAVALAVAKTIAKTATRKTNASQIVVPCLDFLDRSVSSSQTHHGEDGCNNENSDEVRLRRSERHCWPGFVTVAAPELVRSDFNSESLALARSIDPAVVSTQPAPVSSPVLTLPFSMSSSCCSILASSCLHQAMKRSGAVMRCQPFLNQRKNAKCNVSVPLGPAPSYSRYWDAPRNHLSKAASRDASTVEPLPSASRCSS